SSLDSIPGICSNTPLSPQALRSDATDYTRSRPARQQTRAGGMRAWPGGWRLVALCAFNRGLRRALRLPRLSWWRRMPLWIFGRIFRATFSTPSGTEPPRQIVGVVGGVRDYGLANSPPDGARRKPPAGARDDRPPRDEPRARGDRDRRRCRLRADAADRRYAL